MNCWFRFQMLIAGVLVVSATGCGRNSGIAAWPDQGQVTKLRESFGEGKAAKTEVAIAAEPTGFATITGTFLLEGAAPSRAALTINKDMDVCMPGGKPVLGETLVVDSKGGIKDVVIYCITKMPAGDPKWEDAANLSAKDAKVIFDQKNCVFLTHMLAVRTGQTVILKNSDPIGHNTNIVAKGKALSANVTIASNSTSDYPVSGESSEPFDVSCSIHPWMSAKMITRDNPYFAVTKADGTFEIKNVPAGVPLEFKVWQESAKFIQNVKLNGAAAKWPKGKLTLKDNDVLKPGENRKLDVIVDVSSFK
jgi:plastocyanin